MAIHEAYLLAMPCHVYLWYDVQQQQPSSCGDTYEGLEPSKGYLALVLECLLNSRGPKRR